MSHKLSAATLRIILFVLLFLLIAGGVIGFIFVRRMLVEQALAVAEISARASTSQSKVQNLQRSLVELDSNKSVEGKVRDMVATGLQYTYQDQIVNALKTLGESAGVKVTNILFEDAKAAGAAAPATGQNAAAATVPLPAGIKLTQANVTLATPVRYDNLLKFMHAVEQNTMTMKVSKLSISKSEDSKSNSNQMLVNCDVLTIGVYTR